MNKRSIAMTIVILGSLMLGTPPAHAASSAPQIIDPAGDANGLSTVLPYSNVRYPTVKGDANAINGQSLQPGLGNNSGPVQKADSDIVSIALASTGTTTKDGSVSSAGTHVSGKHKKTYVGGAGEMGPWGRDCGRGEPELGQPDISQGGACFQLAPGATSVTVTVTDRVSPHVMAQVLFFRDDKPLYYKYFCDTIHFDSAPQGANKFAVSLLAVLEVLEIVPKFAKSLPCTNATPGTTGTVTATF